MACALFVKMSGGQKSIAVVGDNRDKAAKKAKEMGVLTGEFSVVDADLMEVLQKNYRMPPDLIFLV